MVKIKVSDSGECRVTVKGPWDTVQKNLQVAANKVRGMAHDSRQFASITDGTFIPPMQTPRQPPRQPREDHPQEFRQERPPISRPVAAERPAGGAA